jgi:PhzF family phenazine biosynthesis protein
MKVQVAIVRAFVEHHQGGNPAGVVLQADQLSQAQKQAVAKAVGYSETAFVSASAVADFKLEFFTPNRQIAHCGHATIAAFNLLRAQGLLPQQHSSKETIDGIRTIRLQQDLAFMQQQAPVYQSVEAFRPLILSALGLQNSDISANPLLVNTGNPFVLLGVPDKARLSAITPDLNMLDKISQQIDLIGFYIFSTDTYQPGRAATTRMFAPRFGIAEEAATGMAAGPLACYLHDFMQLKQQTLLIEQGYAMAEPSPSLLQVELTVKNDLILTLETGGRAAVSHWLELDLAD